MEKNENPTGGQNFASSLCAAGCGFFGNPQFDGMCSKCFKESVKRRNALPASLSPVPRTTSASPVAASEDKCDTSTTTSSTSNVLTAPPTVSMPSATEVSASAVESCSTPAEATLPEAPVAPSEVASVPTDISPAASPATPTSGKKRNRCLQCKKKVGLTGFSCRCGGLFCGLHRYSDKHDCQFNYKKEGEEEIRKNNPVVKGAKIAQI